MADFKDIGRKQREDFIDFWVKYMKIHSDEEWSQQQNVLINSVLKVASQMSRQEYAKFKKSIMHKNVAGFKTPLFMATFL